jgi:hypothetical protein
VFATFLEKVGGLFDRRFMVAHWMPSFFGLALATTIVLMSLGWGRVFGWWAALSGPEQAWLGLGSLLVVTMAAYVLQTLPVVRLYEGYSLPDRIRSRATNTRQWERNQLRKSFIHGPHTAQGQSDYQTYHFNYPQDPNLVRPTRLGNLLTAAEEHPHTLYNMDAVVWWPRLVPLLPESFRALLDQALTPMLALLNLSLLLALVSLIGAAFLLVAEDSVILILLVFLVGMLLSWSFYRAALAQAASYGNLLRVTFDLYRHEVLKQLRLSPPSDLVEERQVWQVLTQLFYRYINPWDIAPTAAPDASQFLAPGRYPFEYQADDVAPPAAVQAVVDARVRMEQDDGAQ